MKNIKIKYNPYLLVTDITIDGEKPKRNSAFNVGNKRLQEWVEKLPQIVIDELRDCNLEVEFIGLDTDFEDLQMFFQSYKDKISAKFIYKNPIAISAVEKEVDDIFTEIQNGPVNELRDNKIVDAFKKAKNTRFEVCVIATMSSGKSTLINALLGKQLMPAANKATTATIVKIIDTEQEKYTATAYDKSSNIVDTIDDVNLNDMIRLNNDETVSLVELRGKIPFVSSLGMRLVLIDTPGPNNSVDLSHKELTYKMIDGSDKSLVLYVMNGRQLKINDESKLLDDVCKCMKKGGKQSRERFIFAVNQMDAFKPYPEQEGGEGIDCINTALDDVRKGLENRGIDNPNIFPVCALPALQKRVGMKGRRAKEFNCFKDICDEFEVSHLDNYYKYNNLPESVGNIIEKRKSDATTCDDLVEINTGIVSIEQAIAQYINKYARTTKIRDLVSSFNEKLKELAAVANIENAIRKDKIAKADLEKQIIEIKAKIYSASNAKKLSEMIDKVDLKGKVESEVKGIIDDTRTSISKLLSGHSNKVKIDEAKNSCLKLKEECESIQIKIKVRIENILTETYNETIYQIVEEYKKYLSELNMDINANALSFNPVNLVISSLTDLETILDINTNTVDESYSVPEIKTVPKRGNFIRRTANFLTFGLIDYYTYETEYFNKKVPNFVKYVDMNEVASGYLMPFQKGLNKTQKSAVDYIVSETNCLKEHLKKELVNIEEILKNKLDDLSKTEANCNLKTKEIEEKERNLIWLENIQKKIDNIIDF